MTDKMKRREFLKFLVTSGIVVTSGGGVVSLLSGCAEEEKTVSVESTYDFLDHLAEAEINTANHEYVKRASFTIHNEAKEVLFEHPDSHITFHGVPIHRNARLVFGIGMNEPAWDKEGDGVLFEIMLADETGKKHSLYSRYIDPKNKEEDRRWFDEEIDLTPFERKTVSFTFTTTAGPQGNLTCDWAGWSEPQLSSIVKKQIPKPRHTNVILITVDTLRADYLNCYGMKNIITKNIDRLAREGILFTNCFCQSTTTNPSHASILTSLYPKDHLVYSNTDFLSEKIRRIPEEMHDHGIRTCGIVSAPHLNPDVSGFGKGFDTFLPCTDLPSAAAAATNKKVFHWLEKNHEKQFFMWIHYFDPHAPYTPPAPYKNLYYQGDPKDPLNKTMRDIEYPKPWLESDYIDWLKGITDIDYPIAQYKGEISYLDEQLGLLMKEIRECGLQDNTMIIFTSDHGESLGEHNIYFDHAGLYTPTVKVPLIIWHPDKFNPGVIDRYVESVDIMPTILDFSGFLHPPEIRGKSLLPLIHGKEKEIRELVFCEYAFATQAMIRSNKWSYILSLENSFYTNKFFFNKNQKELYRLEDDPEELKNILDAYPHVADEYNRELTAWLKDTKKIAKPSKKHAVSKELEEKLRALGYAK